MAGTTHTITLKFVGTQNVTASIRQIDGGMQVMGKGLVSFNQKTTQTIAGTSQIFKNISKIGRQTIGTFLNVGNSLRLVSQGMMSFGKALTMFITPIVFILLKKAADAAIGFDDALVRVQKTTGLTRKRLRELALGLRDIAVTTSTTAVDLAKIAEEIGKQGVTSIKSILSLVDTFNMLTVATEIGADKVASSMGKIANAFGIDLNTEEGAKEILRLANVINRLENNLATTAPEILNGLEKLAQVGSLLEFDPAIGAALIAALTAVGFSAEEAGRGVRNATVKLIQHADEVANVMKNTEKYNTTLEVLAAITENADDVLLDFIAGMAAGDEKALALAAAIDILGIRGGKSVAGLAGAYDTLQLSLALTADELEKNNSLWWEYQRALLSTKSQMKVLRNNANEIAMVFGDTLLPVINQVIQTIIPALRWAAKEFKAMSPALKKNIVLIALFIAALGPMVLFLSQIVFALSMVIMGIARFGQVIMSIGSIILQLTGGVGGLGKAFAWLIGIIGGLPGVIALAITAIVLRFTGLGKVISEFFLSLAEKAAAWGENLIANFGIGMLSAAVNILARVLTAIGNFIGRFLAGSSPPDIGPLSHIDRWGQNVFDAFLRGFANADFSILSRVGSIIEKVLSSFAKVEKIGEKKQFIFAMEARKDLAKLIKIFNETGTIAEDVMAAIIQNMGEAGDEIEELIRLWLDYTRIQKELAALEKQREGVLDLYRQEIQLIAQSNMTAEEKADAIRAAMRGRDEELRLLSQEERELQKQKSLAEEQLDLQRSMIDAMQHQDDLQLRLLDTLDKLGKKFDALEDFAFPDVGFDASDWTDDVAETYEAILTLEESIGRMAGVWDAFLAGFRGEPLDIEGFLLGQLGEEGLDWAKRLGLDDVAPDLVPIVEQMERMHEFGGKVGTAWENITGFISDAKTFIEDLRAGEIKILPEGLAENVQSIADALSPIGQFFTDNMDNILLFVGTFLLLRPLLTLLSGLSFAGIATFLSSIGPGIAGLFTAIATGLAGGAIGNFIAAIGLLPGAFAAGGLKGIMGVIVSLLGPVTALALAIALLIYVIVTKGPAAWKALKQLWFIIKYGVMLGLSKASEWAGNLLTTIGDWFKGINVEDMVEAVRTALDQVGAFIVSKFEEFKVGLSREVQKLVDMLDEKWEIVKVNALLAWDRVTQVILDAWETVKDKLLTWDEIKTILSTKWDEIKVAAVTKWDEITATISTAWETVKTTVATKWEEIKTALSTKWDEIKTAVETKVAEWVGVLEGAWESFKTAGADLIQGVIDGINSKLAGVVTAVEDIYNAALEWWKKIWKLRSASRIMFESGQFIMQGAVEGIESMSEEFKMSFVGATSGLLGGMGGMGSMPLTPAFAGGINTVTSGATPPQITLKFGRDSVRSDRDIEDITDAVERVLAERAEGNMGVGISFGDEL